MGLINSVICLERHRLLDHFYTDPEWKGWVIIQNQLICVDFFVKKWFYWNKCKNIRNSIRGGSTT